MKLNETQEDALFNIIVSYYGEFALEETEYNIESDVWDYLISIGKRDFNIEVSVSNEGAEVTLLKGDTDSDITLKVQKQPTII